MTLTERETLIAILSAAVMLKTLKNDTHYAAHWAHVAETATLPRKDRTPVLNALSIEMAEFLDKLHDSDLFSEKPLSITPAYAPEVL